jgi:ABC-type multidrug transport system ATPase subunit
MVLRVENLSKSFGKNLVFHDISFSVNKGEIVCIRGKSGEGKTTLSIKPLQHPGGQMSSLLPGP